MKTVNVSEQAAEINALLEEARNEDLLVRTVDGSEFMLFAVDDFEQEIAATRKNDKLMALLERRARQTKTISLDEVKHRLGLSDSSK